MPAADLLLRLADGATLSAEDADAAFGEALDGAWGEAELAALLTALRLRGETADELFGAASALRRRSAPLALGVPGLLDTCGTGGDHAGTFNISTAAALVAAAAGAKVAKHGNRAVSRSSGSADVLERLGVPLLAEPDQVRASLERFGFAFQGFAIETAIREYTGADTGSGKGDHWRPNSTNGFTKLFSSGALLLFAYANRTVVDLSDAPVRHFTSPTPF